MRRRELIQWLGLGTAAVAWSRDASGAAAKGANVTADVSTCYVAANGKDEWPGTKAQPFASLHAAQRAARKVKAPTRRIIVRGGDYFLEHPLVLRPEDSGLVLEGAEGERATLYGGRRISGWKPDGDSLWAAELPEVKAGTWDFRMLAVNGRMCPRARLPKTGHFTHLSEFRVPWMSTTGGGWKRKPTAAELTTLKVHAKDIGPWLSTKNAELTVYHMWDESVVGVKSNDRKTHTIRFTNPAGHPPGAFGVRKYVVRNVRQGMTEPGQWYLDREAGKVVYWPLPGEDMAKASAIAPTMESIIALQSDGNKRIRNVVLRRLTLSVTNTPLKAGGFGAGKFAGAVEIHKAADCRIEDVTVVNVGGQGIREWGSTGLRIERCHVHHTGACGVKVGGGDAVVADCHIHHVGRAYPSAIALWGGGKAKKGMHFLHNHVHDTPYTAIACGGDNHVIEHNRIHAAMQELHDGAGIYITFCKNVVLRGNFIHDIVDTGGYGASAYYLDEQAEKCLVEGNLSLRVARPSHNHMARKNTLRNNVFVCDGDATITFAKSSDYCLESNVIVAKGRITFTNPGAMTAFRRNVVHSGKGQVVGTLLLGYKASGQAPLDIGDGSVAADPKLLSFEDGRVSYAKNSPALGLGIRPIDVRKAGVRPR